MAHRNSAGRVPWGADHHRAYAELFDRTAGMVVICEDLPEAENRVTLDPDLTDTNGIPAPRISYTLSENSTRMLAHAVARGGEVLEASGASATRRGDAPGYNARNPSCPVGGRAFFQE